MEMGLKGKLNKSLSVLFAVLALSVFAVGASADVVTPYEDENEYYEESYSDESNYDDSSYDESSYDESSYDESSDSSTDESSDVSGEDESQSGSESQSSSESKSESSAKAAATTINSENNASSGDESTESGTDENYQVFGKMGNKSNDVTGFLNTIAISCMAVGAVGLICVIVWSASTREIKKKSDDYIYETVGNAEREGRTPQKRENPYNYRDNYNVNPRSSAPQRHGAPQQRQQPQHRPAQRPSDQRPASQAQRPAAPHAAAPAVRQRPVQDKAQHTVDIPSMTKQRRPVRSSDQFDTDEILSEILGDKRNNN